VSGVGLGAGAWLQGMLNTLKANLIGGIYSMPNGTDTFTVSGLSLGTTNYAVVITISNTVDVSVRHLHANVTAKTATSFTFMTEQTTDHANYKAEYLIYKL
jgi:hypothetical protein